MYHELGPRSRRIYLMLRERILSGEYAPGAALPASTRIATQFGVSTVTARLAVAQLEHDGLVTRQHGRGTFVQGTVAAAQGAAATVLIVDDDKEMRELLGSYAAQAGHRAVDAASPDEALAVLASDPAIALVLTDVRMPDRASGIAFLRAVYRQWPALPVAAITGYPDDLAEMHGAPECPVLILAKPVWEQQIREVFRWVMGTNALSSRVATRK